MKEQNLASVRQFWQAFNAHKIDEWDKLCTADFINHDPGLPTPEADLSTLKQSIKGLLQAFPDLTSSEDDLVSEGDKVVVRRTLSGTHKGDFMGIPASGNKVTFDGVWLAHLSGGKFKEQWVYFNALGLMQQIGGMPGSG